MTHCPLCLNPGTQHYHNDGRRDYRHCPHCQLVFVPAAQRPDPSREKAEYDLHRNDPEDTGYRRFLSRLTEPLVARLAPGAQGLDFGCGPGPALAAVLREQGFHVEAYDPFYAPDPAPLAREYDFITATEVIEHLHHPHRDMPRLWSLLRPGGWLGLMTKLVQSREAFATWHYIRDPTHVAFYSRETFGWLAAEWGARLEIVGADVIFLQKLG